jgi:hypothetical protein
MDLRDMYNTWKQDPGDDFFLTLPLEKTGCPCNRVPRALWKLRHRIILHMQIDGHELHFNPRYEMRQDGVGIRCQRCALLVSGFITRITGDSVTLCFITPCISTCEECLAEIPY